MIDPVTLSTLASSFANSAASAVGSEVGKDIYRAVSQGMSYCPCRSQDDTKVEVMHLDSTQTKEGKYTVVKGVFNLNNPNEELSFFEKT